MEPFMTVIEFAGISDFIGCDQKYENSYSEVLRFIRERMTFRVYTSVRDKFYLILVFVFIIPVGCLHKMLIYRELFKILTEHLWPGLL